MLYDSARKVVVAVVGGTVVLFGIVLIFTPGPAMIVIPAGLAILATEFVWARIMLRKVKSRARSAARVVTDVIKGNRHTGGNSK